MILAWLIIIPVAGGLLAWILSCWNSRWPRWSALTALTIDLAIILKIWLEQFSSITNPGASTWLIESESSMDTATGH